jgi:Holliday junction DNA helicase RuvA
LSGVDTGLLIDAIIQGDQAFLTKVPGIGKKTAERVVVELRDTIQKKLDAGTLSRTVRLPVSDKSQSTDINAAAVNMHTDALILRDAKDALVGLGYRDQDIHQLLSRLLSSGEFRPKRAEELVRTALRQLA